MVKKSKRPPAEQSEKIARTFSDPRAVVAAMQKGVQDAIGPIPRSTAKSSVRRSPLAKPARKLTSKR